MVSSEANESLRPRPRPAAQAGYNLVFLIALFTLMSVMLTAALPVISTQIQREREAELIFRGLQYAEGIRVFQQRFGRFPNTLEELIELEPRSIRQLWTDPMTENGRWALVLASSATQPGAAVGEDEPEDGRSAPSNLGQELGGGSAPTSNFSGPSSAGEITAGPIMGVVTRHQGQSLRTFLGKDSYQEWRFTANILPTPKVVPGTEIVASGSVENLGKPFPRGLTPQGLAGDGGEGLAGGDAPRDLFGDDDEDGG